MPARLFTFVQMEIPWELGPPDGRYLLRTPPGPQGGQPQHVAVLSTLGATRRGVLGRRARTTRTSTEPPSVVVARATVIDAIALSAERQAEAWLAELDPEREAQNAAGVLNRLLQSHRIATANPHVHEVSPTQALALRAGYGEGEQVAEGLWLKARALVLSRRAALRRVGVLRPQERLAGLLSGADEALMCEELCLRARRDLDEGRVRLAALELERAYATGLGELERGASHELRSRLQELGELRVEVERAAACALEREDPDETSVRRALERLEATLRARAAAGVL